MREGVNDPHAATDALYRRTNLWLADVLGLGPDAFDGPEHVVAMLDRDLDSELESLGDR